MKLFRQALGQGPTVILLHGLLGSGDNWLPLAKLLAADFHVVVPDLRNHGRSPHAATGDLPALAQDVCELLDEAGWLTASLVGHSLGGKVAMQFARQFPERTDRLVVADIAPRAYPPWHAGVFTALLGLDLDRLSSRSEAEAALATAVPDAPQRQWLLKNLGRSPDGRLIWRANVPGLAEQYPALCAAPPATGRFPGPVLFLRGEKSPYFAAADEALCRAAFPQAEVRTIPGAGHWLHVDAPAAVLAACRQHLLA